MNANHRKLLPSFTLTDLCPSLAGGPFKNLDVCREALRGALARLASGSPTDYPSLAQTMRQVVEISGTDAERLALLRDAAGLLSATPPGEYPNAEAAWLATYTWNRGAAHARFMRPAEAEAFMRLALEMAERAPSLSGEGEAMGRELTRVQGLLAAV
jgi:hypothetical protein